MRRSDKLRGTTILKISLIDLIEMIHGSKRADDFFREDTDLDVDEYLERISNYSPNDHIVFAADSNIRRHRFCAGFDEQAIDVGGIVIFYYVLHNDDFFCERVENTEKMYDRLYKSVRNPFIGEFMVFKDGVKRNYRVKNAHGETLHSDEIDRRKLHELIIEWY